MTNSIIEESRNARGVNGAFKGKKTKRNIIILIVILGIASSAYAIFSQDNNTVEEVAQKEWVVKEGDLTTSLENDGKVVAEDGVELSFSVSSDTLEVNEVFVTEGQHVSRGDAIASVKTDELEFALQSAYASYQSALASLNAKQAEPTEDEIKKAQTTIDQAQVSLDQAKISLDQTKLSGEQQIQNAERALASAENNLKLNENNSDSQIVDDAYSDLMNSLKSIIVTMESAMQDSDNVLGVDNTYINDDFENLLGAKSIQTLNTAKNSYRAVSQQKSNLEISIISLNSGSDQSAIDSVAREAEITLNDMIKHLYDVQSVLSATVTSSSFPQSELDSLQSSVSSARASVSSATTSITNNIQAVSSAKNSLTGLQITYDRAVSDLNIVKQQVEKNIANAEASVSAREVSLEQAQIAYDQLIAPVREVDLASSRAQVTAAAVNVDKAQYNIEQATLTSPIDGEIALLNYKAGDIINRDDNQPMAIVINNDTLFIEVHIEEADINDVKVGQKVYITFDAVDDLELEGEISFISLTSGTDNNGIVTYLVRIIISNTGDKDIREGMTAFVDFVISEVNDVLIIPVSAVRNVDGEPSVELTSHEWRPVTTGFTDGKYVEVISGLEEGDVILY